MVTAETITPNDDGITPRDNHDAGEYRRYLDHIDALIHASFRRLDEIQQALADQGAEIGSVNAQIAELTAQLQPLWPLIPRVLALLDPMRKMRKPKPDAVPE